MLRGLIVAVLARNSQQLQRLSACLVQITRSFGDSHLKPLRVGDSKLGFALRRDVACHPVNHAFRRASVHTPLQPQVAPIRRATAVAEPNDVARTVSHRGDLCDGCLAVVGMDELEERPRAHRLGGMAERALPRRVHAKESSGHIRRHEQVERSVEMAHDLRLQPTAVIDKATKQSAQRQERNAMIHIAPRGQQIVRLMIPRRDQPERHQCAHHPATQAEPQREHRDRQRIQGPLRVTGVRVAHAQRRDTEKQPQRQSYRRSTPEHRPSSARRARMGDHTSPIPRPSPEHVRARPNSTDIRRGIDSNPGS